MPFWPAGTPVHQAFQAHPSPPPLLSFQENFCRETGTRAPESSLHDCCSCEDQYLKTLEGRGRCQQPDNADTWICRRCDGTREAPLAVGPAGHPKETIPPRYLRESFPHGKFYVPAPDVGLGWCQARRVKGSGLRPVFLSPLGYELDAKDDIPAQTDFEKAVDASLRASREEEFKEWREAIKATGKVRPAPRSLSALPLLAPPSLPLRTPIPPSPLPLIAFLLCPLSLSSH